MAYRSYFDDKPKSELEHEPILDPQPEPVVTEILYFIDDADTDKNIFEVKNDDVSDGMPPGSYSESIEIMTSLLLERVSVPVNITVLDL